MMKQWTRTTCQRIYGSNMHKFTIKRSKPIIK